jgi:hypothetical protein
VTNSTPANDSFVFSNPYSGNVAIADDTTVYNFEVKVTDEDGVTDLDYVELRFANSEDNVQSYDSLKLRWSESTNTFSKEADSQNAISLMSTFSDSSVLGNQATLNFKVKFNSNFAVKDTDYAAEVYSVDDAGASDIDDYPSFYKVADLSISLTLDLADLSFGSLLPGSVVTGTTTATTSANYSNGYSLSVSDGVAGDGSTLLHTDGATRIIDYIGNILTPSAWNGTGLGICLYAGSSKDISRWGNGESETSSSNKYAGIPENPVSIYAKTGFPTVNDSVSVGYKLVVPNTQKSGSYSGNITFTATGVLQ